jgi:hypothetical protein
MAGASGGINEFEGERVLEFEDERVLEWKILIIPDSSIKFLNLNAAH